MSSPSSSAGRRRTARPRSVALAAAAALVPHAHASRIAVGRGVALRRHRLDARPAAREALHASALRNALAGAPRALPDGPARDPARPRPVLATDLRRGEAIALPIAFAVLLAVLGLSLAASSRSSSPPARSPATLGVVWLLAHDVAMVSYVTNLVELIGLGLAIDYSLLVVYRFREELARGDRSRTPSSGRWRPRAARSSSPALAVAIGLALLLFVPVPFIRSIGIGGFLSRSSRSPRPLTLQPALLSLLGRARLGRSGPAARAADRAGFWARARARDHAAALSCSCSRRGAARRGRGPGVLRSS